MSSLSKSDSDYEPAFMHTAEGRFDNTSADFFHEKWTMETAMVVETPPPVDVPPNPPLNLQQALLPLCPGSEQNPFVDQIYYNNNQPFPMIPPLASAPFSSFLKPSFPWADMSSTPSSSLRLHAPKTAAAKKAPKPKAAKPKKELRLNPITGHPMPPVSKPRVTRPRKMEEEEETTQDGPKKKRKKAPPRDEEAERDAHSRKENQCYQKGTILVRFDEIDQPNYGRVLWIVDSYQLIQKFVLEGVERDGRRLFTRTERFAGWLADDPAIYFPVENVVFPEPNNKDNIILHEFPPKEEVHAYFERMKVNRPVFPKIEVNESSSAMGSSPGESNQMDQMEESSDEEIKKREIKMEEESADESKEDGELSDDDE